MATGHRSHGWGRPLLAALVALVAVLGTAGFAAAAPAPAETTYRLYFEARLCPLPLPPLTGPSSTSYVALCRLASDERAVVRVGLHEGQAATFQLPFYTGRAHYPR